MLQSLCRIVWLCVVSLLVHSKKGGTWNHPFLWFSYGKVHTFWAVIEKAHRHWTFGLSLLMVSWRLDNKIVYKMWSSCPTTLKCASCQIMVCRQQHWLNVYCWLQVWCWQILPGHGGLPNQDEKKKQAPENSQMACVLPMGKKAQGGQLWLLSMDVLIAQLW